MLKLLFLLLVVCSCQDIKKAKLIEGKTKSQYEAIGENYIIATQGEATTNAAKYIFEKGGNIYDAAIAASFVISVERPHSTGIGGGGFLLAYDAKTKKNFSLDFREVAPIKSSKDMYLDQNKKQIKDKSITGSYAVGVPGLVAGMIEVHKKFGSLSLEVIMKPAIDLARNGMKVYPALSKALEYDKKRLCQFESTKKIFLKEDCSEYRAGEILYQKDLADTLERISKMGNEDFYYGKTAKLIVDDLKNYGAPIVEDDFKNYKVKYRGVVEGHYRGHKIVSMPPPSSGGTHIIQILNILENFPLKKYGAQSFESTHLQASAMQMAFADRASYMGDADFAMVPVKELVSKNYAKNLAQKISMNKTISSKDLQKSLKKIFKESDHTTHFTIMDKMGNIVSSTQTINGWFGSALVAKGTGIILNNEMDDFASHVGGVNLFGAIGGVNNLVEPGKRPLSSMSPTIVFDKENKPLLALGTPSGTRILTCVMQTILNRIEFDMSLWDAVSATRIHHQWYPESLRVGPPGLDDDVIKRLKSIGYKIKDKGLGCKVQAVEMLKSGKLLGVSDPREEGMAFGN